MQRRSVSEYVDQNPCGISREEGLKKAAKMIRDLDQPQLYDNKVH